MSKRRSSFSALHQRIIELIAVLALLIEGYRFLRSLVGG